jgi:hypothetical protein
MEQYMVFGASGESMFFLQIVDNFEDNCFMWHLKDRENVSGIMQN